MLNMLITHRNICIMINNMISMGCATVCSIMSSDVRIEVSLTSAS